MAQTQFPFRANIQTSLFPLLSQLGAKTVIDPKGDQTFVPNVNPSDQVAPVDRGIPQVYYCHNVMPSTYGFQSVGYKTQYNPYGGGAVDMDKVELVISIEGVRTYVAWDFEIAKTILILAEDGVWFIPSNAPADLNESTVVTVAAINGITYICVAFKGVWKYNATNHALEPVTLEGLNVGTLKGIVASSGYLLAWTDATNLVWSSSNDPLDFVPSDISGAGGGALQEAEGSIVTVVKTSYGFIVYTTNNAVSGTFSGNTSYPFNFKAIPSSGGLASASLVTREVTGAQYAYTSNGIQQVYHTGAKTVLSYVTDFIAGQIFEDYNESTGQFEISNFDNTMRKKISLISDRYLVISYGMNPTGPLTHAIVIDVTQSRMGKLKHPHNQVFELRNLNPEVVETPRSSIALLEPGGKVVTVDFSFDSPNSNGVIFLGKYQLARVDTTELMEVTLENVPNIARMKVTDWLSYDGKSQPVKIAGTINPEKTRDLTVSYLFHVDAMSHSLMVEGLFNIICPILWLNLGGDN